jgi:hypothetical protein
MVSTMASAANRAITGRSRRMASSWRPPRRDPATLVGARGLPGHAGYQIANVRLPSRPPPLPYGLPARMRAGSEHAAEVPPFCPARPSEMPSLRRVESVRAAKCAC